MSPRVPPRPLGRTELEGALAEGALGAWLFEPAEDPAEAVPAAADELPAGELVRQLRFPSFAAAVAFLVEVAPACDAADHHPAWRNTYDRVEVRLTTHEARNRVTARDVDLAEVMEARFLELHGG